MVWRRRWTSYTRCRESDFPPSLGTSASILRYIATSRILLSDDKIVVHVVWRAGGLASASLPRGSLDRRDSDGMGVEVRV